MKSFQDEELPHELFLGTRQETKISNTFANNMSREIKLSKSQISSLANLGKKLLTSIAILLVRDNLPGFVNNFTSDATNKRERKIRGKGAVKAGKGFTLFISN